MSKWVPEIVYEEGATIPFISVPQKENMPDKLFMFEYKETGEYEPGPVGEDVPVTDVVPHIYFSYQEAKKKLGLKMLNEIRVAFGLQELSEAVEEGRKITASVAETVGGDKKELPS